jgi:hypothetical protein
MECKKCLKTLMLDTRFICGYCKQYFCLYCLEVENYKHICVNCLKTLNDESL